MGRISMATRDELVVAVAGRYARASRLDWGRILDEFVAMTGLHRKHAMRLLRGGQASQRSGPRPGRRVYDDAIREALVVIWKASDRICGKRLRPLVPTLVEAMERHGHVQFASRTWRWRCRRRRTAPMRRAATGGAASTASSTSRPASRRTCAAGLFQEPGIVNRAETAMR